MKVNIDGNVSLLDFNGLPLEPVFLLIIYINEINGHDLMYFMHNI